MITLDDYFMGRDALFPAELTMPLRLQAANTIERCNQLLIVFGEWRGVNSGWRPPAVNAATPRASRTSYHMTCQACDIEDSNGLLDRFCLENPNVLVHLGLWQEHPDATPGWCHVQTLPPRSGNRVFQP